MGAFYIIIVVVVPIVKWLEELMGNSLKELWKSTLSYQHIDYI
jgi:hypothetical protein